MPRRLNLFLLLLAAIISCGKPGPQRAIVSGTVKYRGEPIESGMIRFVPLEKGAGPMAGALIEGGKYEVNALGGVPVGRCRVEIKSRKAVPSNSAAKNPPDVEGLELIRDATVQLIPEKYNTKSRLEVTIAAEGEVTHDFDLR